MKTEFKLSKEKGSTMLTIEGDLTAQAGDQFKIHLQQLCEDNVHGVLSLKEVRSMDVSSIQLIQSFKAFASQRIIQVDLPEDKELLDLLQKTGLISVFQINNQ